MGGRRLGSGGADEALGVTEQSLAGGSVRKYNVITLLADCRGP